MKPGKTRIRMAIALISLLITVTTAYAWERGRPVTPYGDFCPRCSRYGKCRFILNNQEASKALNDYYRKKGLSVKIKQRKGRFIKAVILDNGRIVDTIIFDRHSGRIRSIY
jgi:hypothetical protein